MRYSGHSPRNRKLAEKSDRLNVLRIALNMDGKTVGKRQREAEELESDTQAASPPLKVCSNAWAWNLRLRLPLPPKEKTWRWQSDETAQRANNPALFQGIT